MSRQTVHADGAPPALGPYSHAVSGGGFLFASGQIGLDPATNEMVGPDIESQTRRVLDNLGTVLAAGNSGFDRVVKVTVYLADFGDFQAMNEVYGAYFSESPPARACVAVKSLPKDARVEIDAVAMVAE